MCGLAGVVCRARNDGAEALARLRPYLRRRGPDDEGLRKIGGCTFLHARLAINDLSVNARQPFVSEDGAIMAMCNGEIYNYSALRQLVLANGHQLHSHSDNEVIVHLYQDHGPEFIHLLEGEFAIAIWDNRKQLLFLARDRFGVKPLYYLEQEGNFYFSSDFASLACEILSDKTLSREALNLYLVFRYVPAPLTLFQAIKKVSPGHYLLIGPNSTRDVTYWQLAPNPARFDVEQAVVDIRDAVLSAVESRLMSDVPVGVFLSGGLDSAVIVAAMKELGRECVRTFSIGFSDEANDPGNEFPFSDAVAAAFHTDHTRIVTTEESVYSDFQQWIEAMGEPIGAPAAIPLFQLARRAAGDVKVVLNGQGADEMFGGYGWYQAMLRRYGELPTHSLFLACYAGVQESEKNHLLSPGWKLPRIAEESVESVLRRLDPSIVREQPLDAVTFLDSHFGLPEIGLKEVDAATMFFGLEARVPFLAAPLVSLAAGLPHGMKICGGEEKFTLRRAFEHLLPSSVARRQKLGFPVPVAAWYRGQLGSLTRSLLLSRRALERGIFDESKLHDLLLADELSSDCSRNRTFRFLVLELWLRKFIDGDDNAVDCALEAAREEATHVSLPVPGTIQTPDPQAV